MRVYLQTEIAQFRLSTKTEEVRVRTEVSDVSRRLQRPITDIDLTCSKVAEHHIEIRIVMDDQLLREWSEGRRAEGAVLVDCADSGVGSR